MLDWLVSRRHCNKDWQKSVVAIREKIKHAILDMPESPKIVELLQGAYINYFHCCQIIEILRDTEKDTKNFLGFYSSQRMKDWQEIEGMYKKDNVYLAEAAQILQRLAQYEIPALRKQISKMDQSVTDAIRKHSEYGKQAEDGRKQFEKEISRMQLKGVHLRKELLELAADLPAFYEKITAEIRKISAARDYFQAFRDYMSLGAAPKDAAPILPIIGLIGERGLDVTTYEWKYNQKPDKVEKPNFEMLLTAAEDSDEIDFGGGDEIDFGIAAEDDAVIDFSAVVDLVADDTGAVGEAIASGQDALHLLENSEAQKAVKHELIELLAFLSMRLDDETRETTADVLIRGAEKRPDGVAAVTEKRLKTWITEVEGILKELENPQKVHLFKIRGSPQYVEQVVEELEKKRDMEHRYKRLQTLMTENQETARQSVTKSNVELKTIVESTRVLQKQIEAEISKKYNGRRVNLMGGINQALGGN